MQLAARIRVKKLSTTFTFDSLHVFHHRKAIFYNEWKTSFSGDFFSQHRPADDWKDRSGIVFAMLGRDPRAFQIRKISVVNP